MNSECITPWTTSLATTTVRLPCVFIDELRRKNKNSPTHSGTSAAAFSSALVVQLFCVQEANAGHHTLNLGGQGYINPNQRRCLVISIDSLLFSISVRKTDNALGY